MSPPAVRGRRWWLAGVLGGVVVAFLTVATLAGAWPEGTPRVIAGVSCLGTPLDGLDAAAAQHALGELQVGDRPVRVAAEDLETDIPLHALGVRIDAALTAERALAVGRRGHWLARIGERGRAKRHGVSADPALRVDQADAAAFLSALAEQVNRPAADARLDLGAEGEFLRVAAVTGQQLLADAAMDELRRWLAGAESLDRPLVLPVAEIAPARTLDAYAGIDTELARFRTLVGGSADRVSNVALAAGALGGLILPPGQEFSFNQVVGPRTKDRGYKEAPIIYAGRLVPGSGGGVCQASTTLFNAAALAGLTILERRNHSQPVPYVLPGRDAAVAYGEMDLRLRNDLPGPVAILTRMSAGQVQFVIAGPAGLPRPRLVTTTPRIQPAPVREVADPALPAGRRVVQDEGAPSIFVITSRVWADEGGERVEELVRSSYPAKPKVVRVGTAPPPESPGPTGENAGAAGAPR